MPIDHIENPAMNVVLDLRAFGEASMFELNELCIEAFAMALTQFPEISNAYCCISQYQLKWLRMEEFERTKDEKWAKHWQPRTIGNISVMIFEGEDGIPCPCCRELH